MSFKDLVLGKAIMDVKQIEGKFQKDEPRSIFRPYYKLSGTHGYYRRGDSGGSYEYNFIPIWFYGLFREETIIYLRPCKGTKDKTPEEEFFDYCGVTLDQLLKLIKLNLVVPLIADRVEAYSENVFGNFMQSLPEDKPLIRSHLFEDAFLKERDTTFEREQNGLLEDRFKKISHDDQQIKEYERFRASNPTLVPSYEKLRGWLAERALWQQLDGREENVERIEKAARFSPINAYKYTHNLHYTVVPKFYSRGGLSFIARGEDDFIADIEELPLRANNPCNGKLPGLAFKYPQKRKTYREQAEEVEKSIDFLERVIKESKLAEARQKLIKEMTCLWDIKDFYKNLESKHNKNTEKLEGAINGFNAEMLDYMNRHFRDDYITEQQRQRKGEVLNLGFGFASTAAGIAALISGLILLGIAGISTGIFPLYRGIRGIIKPDKLREELESSQGKARFLPGWRDTPFLLIDYPNPT